MPRMPRYNVFSRATDYIKKAGAFVESVYQQLAALLREAGIVVDDRLSDEQLSALLEAIKAGLPQE